MLQTAGFAGLASALAGESDPSRALDLLCRQALLLTGSRNAMIARLNEELGTLELRHGAGKDWTLAALGELIVVSDEREGIIAYVAAKGQSFMSGDVRSEPRYRHLFDTASEIAVPIRDRHLRVRAVLNVESDEPNAYEPDDLLLCEGLAALASLVIEGEALLRRERALVQIGNALDRSRTEDALIRGVLAVAAEVLSFQSCSIFLLDPRREVFVLRGASGLLIPMVGVASYAPGEGLTGWVCREGRPLRMDHPQQDPRWLGRYLELERDQIAAYLAVPIIHRGRPIGAVRVIRRKGSNPFIPSSFTEDDERLLVSIAEQFASGLENVRALSKTIQMERMAAWGELSAKSAHMIGNRVFALRGDVNELGHLVQGKLNVDELHALQKSLAANVTRIEEILQDFRDFVTATQISPAPIDLNELVTETLQEVFPKRSRCDLKTKFDRSLPPAIADSRKLRRAISELIENSLNYMESGTLRVSTGTASARLLEKLKLPRTQAFLTITIEDEGPGVKPEDKSVIFQPFFSSRVKGMGLGLSIVKGILEAHGGTAAEVGKPGKGARFVLILPAQE